MIKEEPYSLTDLIQKTAYGGQWEGLGMPILGVREEGKSNLKTTSLDTFYKHKYTLDRVLIAASGVGNHNEFCKRVQDTINRFTDLDTQGVKTEKSHYTGGHL
jgi:predicted Zn-dependent peptidase